MAESKWNAIQWVKRVLGTRESWTVDGVFFDTRGWRLLTASPNLMTWSDAQDAQITLTQTIQGEHRQPTDLQAARDACREQARSAGAGIVSVERRSAGGVPVLEIISKRKAGRGYEYEGVLIPAANDCPWKFGIKAGEGPTTGVREAMVSAQMWELGEVVLEPPEKPGGPQRLKGWSFDPYDARWDDSAENSLTDDERLDDLLPQHPLSRVRAHLRQVRESLTVRGEPPAGDGTVAAAAQSDLRRFASPAVVRELLWKAERFDLIEASVTAQIPELSGPELARELLMLGLVQARQDKLLVARESLTRAHQLFSAQGGDRHPDTATAATHVARILLDLGRLLDAERYFRKALDVIETTPPNDLVLGMTLNGYGRLLLQQDRASDAMPYVLRAQELVEKQKGEERCFLLRETAGGSPPALFAKMRIVR